MDQVKYFDYRDQRPLDLERDGCDLADWDGRYGQARFARHPKGFMIFLPPARIAACDEYADADPYAVAGNLRNEFHRARLDLTVTLLQEAVSSSPGVVRILDLGCGQGHVTQEMHQKPGKAEFRGLDHSVSAIAYAHEHFPHIDFAVGDVYECPYAQAYFDVVVCNNVWEHVPDPVYLLSRSSGLLKPGGYLIVSTPSRYRIGNLIKVLKGRPVESLSAHHVTEYTVGQVIEQLAHGGFAVERIVSRPLSMRKLRGRLQRWALSLYIWAVGSHHQLAPTVFYSARKMPGRARHSAG